MQPWWCGGTNPSVKCQSLSLTFIFFQEIVWDLFTALQSPLASPALFGPSTALRTGKAPPSSPQKQHHQSQQVLWTSLNHVFPSTCFSLCSPPGLDAPFLIDGPSGTLFNK